MNDNINAREVEILRTLPPNDVMDFIEKNGQRMRSILEQDDQDRVQEEIENLKQGYLGL